MVLPEDITDARAEGGLLGRDTFLNLRDFKSEALVLGNRTALCFDDEAEGRLGVDVDARAAFASIPGDSFKDLIFNEVPEGPFMRRFLRERWIFVLSDVDGVTNAEVDEEVGGTFEIP